MASKRKKKLKAKKETKGSHGGSGSSKRKLGSGYSLALKTGGDPETHLSLVYFHALKRGYEQERVKSIAAEYFAERGLDVIELEYGESVFQRSVSVHGVITDVIKDLAELFSSYDIDAQQVAHVDLRGNRKGDLLTSVAVDSWLY